MSSICPGAGKKTWPELVGENGQHAADIIQRQYPRFRVIVLPVGTQLTGGSKCNRVRVFVKKNGTVASVPYVG
ncbi:unnamed protein product [Rhodiola kirilowii]